MGHSYVEIDDRYLHWPDQKVELFFASLVRFAKVEKHGLYPNLDSALKDILSNPVVGSIDVDLREIAASDKDVQSLRSLVGRVREFFDTCAPELSAEELNRLTLSSNSAYTSSIEIEYFLNAAEELLALLFDPLTVDTP